MPQSTIEVDPSQVHSIEVDASQVSLVPAEKSAWEKFKGHLQTPRLIQDLYGTYTGDPAATYRLGETVAGMAEGLKQEPARIWNESRNLGESMVRGDIPGMAYHAAGMVPILGGQTQSIAQRVGEGAPAEATAEAVDLAAQLLGPKAIERPAAGIGRAAGAVYDTGAGAVETVRSMSPEMRHAAGVGTGAVIGGTVGHAVGGAPGGAIGELVGAYVGGKATRALAREPGAAVERAPVGPTLEQATPVGPTVEQAAPAPAVPPSARPVPSDYPKIKAWAEAQPGGVTLGMIQRQFGANYAEAAAFADALTKDGIPVVSKVKGLGELPTQPEPQVEAPEPVAETAPPPAAERYQPAEPKPAPTAEWMRQNVYTRRGGMQPPPETPPAAPETPAAAPETAGPPPAAPAPEASLATEFRAWAEAQPNGVSPASIQRQFGLPYNAALDVAESLMRDGWKWTEDRRLVKPEATAPTPEPAPPPPPAETPAATVAPGSVEDLSAQLNAELGTQPAPQPTAAPKPNAYAEARQADKIAAYKAMFRQAGLSADDIGTKLEDNKFWNGLAQAEGAPVDAKGKKFGPPSPDARVKIRDQMKAEEAQAETPAAAAETPQTPAPTPRTAGKPEKPFEPSLKTTQTETTRAYQAGKQFANYVRGQEGTAAQIKALGPSDWAAFAKQAGMEPLSPQAMDYAVKELEKFDRLDALAARMRAEEEGQLPEAVGSAIAPPQGLRLGSEPTTGRTTGPSPVNEGEALPQPGRSGAGGRERGAGSSQYGEDTSIRVPGENRGFAARYTVREADDVTPSHNPHTLESNPDYRFRNDRNYKDPRNAERIIKQVSEFDPHYMVTDAPDATNGAPVIDQDGMVLGGNSRTMTIQRVYRTKPEAAQAYKDLLVKKAATFGLDPNQIRGMKQPVLVRELTHELTPETAQSAITDLNKSGTAALTGAERAIADSNKLSESTLNQLAGMIESHGQEGTLAKALEGRGGAFVANLLVHDGVITTQEKPTLFDSTGVLTAAAKDRISKLMLGRLFADSEQLERTPPAVRNKLERIVAPLARVATKEGWDITPQVREAMTMLEEARAAGIKNLDDLVSQQSLFGESRKYSPEVLSLAKSIDRMGPVQLQKAFQQYASDSAAGPMFGEVSPRQSFTDAFGEGSH